MATYLLSIGSNTPDARALMERAGRWIASEFRLLGSSGIYSSPALNGRTADYLNMVARVSSAMSVGEMTACGKEFERLCGRTPQSKGRGAVEMDVDVVQADSLILRPEEFTRSYFTRGLDLLERHANNATKPISH